MEILIRLTDNYRGELGNAPFRYCGFLPDGRRCELRGGSATFIALKKTAK